MNLTSNQYRAITHLKGPCLVLAGPGSGKTFTVVKRIEYLIKKGRVQPENILVVTFTKVAAKEMRERFNKCINAKGSAVTFGTFHSVFWGILQNETRQMRFKILTTAEKNTIIEQILMTQEHCFVIEEVADIIREISAWKNQKMQLQGDDKESVFDKEEFKEIVKLYEEEKNRLGKIDFEDILIQTYQLLSSNRDVLKVWQNKFQYIMVDEFQDINMLQYQIIQLLCSKQKNIFIVGDDDQSIYSFRGGNPKIMLDFEKDYPESKKIILNKNFRSPISIVRRSQKIISNNKIRFNKKSYANSTECIPIIIRKFPNVIEESKYIIEKIEECINKGVPLHDIAILSRSRKDALTLMDTLEEYNIPYFAKEQKVSLYEHFIAKDILSYFKLAIGPRRREDFLRVGNRPNRYLRRDSLNDEEITFAKLYQIYESKSWMHPYLYTFEQDLEFLKAQPPYTAMQYINNKMGYADFLIEYAKRHRISEDALFDIGERLKIQARRYNDIEEWVCRTKSNNRQEKTDKLDVEHKVHISTIHAAKGLEYETIFVIQSNEGTIPYKQAISNKEIEEERRIFYVAITRAKKQLYITYTQEKNGKEVSLSRFVEELIH